MISEPVTTPSRRTCKHTNKDCPFGILCVFNRDGQKAEACQRFIGTAAGSYIAVQHCRHCHHYKTSDCRFTCFKLALVKA